MADAGITWVMGAGDDDGADAITNPTSQKKMLELCEKYGMGMTVHDGNFGANLLSATDRRIQQFVSTYKSYPAAQCYYLLDEPRNPNDFIRAYASLKAADPNAYMHLNSFPSIAFESQEMFYDQLNDWCRLTAATGYPLDYLIFDRYPYGMTAGAMDRRGFYADLRTCHDVGLANNVKTGIYIQSVQSNAANMRAPSAEELRHEVYVALAYGYKQIAYFTWFTPSGRSEDFSGGIMTATGEKGPLYNPVRTVNKEVLALGETLIDSTPSASTSAASATTVSPACPMTSLRTLPSRAETAPPSSPGCATARPAATT